MDEWLQEQIEQRMKLLQLLSSPLCRVWVSSGFAAALYLSAGDAMQGMAKAAPPASAPASVPEAAPGAAPEPPAAAAREAAPAPEMTTDARLVFARCKESLLQNMQAQGPLPYELALDAHRSTARACAQLQREIRALRELPDVSDVAVEGDLTSPPCLRLVREICGVQVRAVALWRPSYAADWCLTGRNPTGKVVSLPRTSPPSLAFCLVLALVALTVASACRLTSPCSAPVMLRGTYWCLR
jgi:hypothetical protein